MADMILDYTVFDDLRNGDSGAREIIEKVLQGEISAGVSPVTVCELWHRGEIDRRTEIGFLSVLRFVEEIVPDIETARTAGLWLVDLGEDKVRDAAYVALTAATAKQLNIPVCTRDTESFERFGIELSSY